MDPTIPIVIAAFAALLLLLGAVVDDRRARVRKLAQVDHVEAVVPLLHSINDDRCIGCEACIEVCPTEVLDLVDHKVKVSRFSDCVQCEQCASSCPTMALVMYRAGGTPRTLTVPELDDHFQTGVPGQYLIGEVAGKPLVKNAANLGRAVIEHVARELAPDRARGDVIDVAIVGSGPGGLSAALTCKKRGLSCVVLEKEHVIASTVARYPKGKHFMAEPADAVNASFLPVFDGSKEQLVAAWREVVDGVGLAIKLGEAVEQVRRHDDGVFAIKTTVASYRAHRVVLATGLRGKPRLLAVPGANLEKVQSLLDDPAEFAGRDVLVVGGGDSAVEGAMSLADVGARVTLSYRGDGFKRCKPANQKRLAEMTSAGKVAVLLESNVAEFTEREVRITCKDGSVQIRPNQRAFVLIGADTPVAWLESNGVRFIERPHLYTLGASDEVVRRMVPDAAECPRSAAESIALVLGRQVAIARPPSRMRSVVGRVRDELRDAVSDLSGVFTIHDRPVPLVPASRLARKAPASPSGRTTGAQTAIGRNPFDGEITTSVTRHNPFDAEPTTVGHAMRPSTPKRRTAVPPPVPPPRRRLATERFAFDNSELEAFAERLPFGEPRRANPFESGDTRRDITPIDSEGAG
ncbi:MAG TPA: NAD(P)-binding domain-containing protein [Kofleriaceae bacterium]|nr:NAD(P)-binding domain-containing protein [Kofleriaceae bacterium]